MTLFYQLKGFKSVRLPFCQSPGLLIVMFCEGWFVSSVVIVEASGCQCWEHKNPEDILDFQLHGCALGVVKHRQAIKIK